MQRKRSVDFLLTVLTLVSGISSASYKVQNKMPKPKRSLSSSSEEEALFSDGKDQKKMTSNSQKKKKKKVHCFQDDEARKQEIRETNKLAARECRARKKRLMSELEKTVGSLTTEHTALVKQNRELTIRLETLQRTIGPPPPPQVTNPQLATVANSATSLLSGLNRGGQQQQQQQQQAPGTSMNNNLVMPNTAQMALLAQLNANPNPAFRQQMLSQTMLANPNGMSMAAARNNAAAASANAASTTTTNSCSGTNTPNNPSLGVAGDDSAGTPKQIQFFPTTSGTPSAVDGGTLTGGVGGVTAANAAGNAGATSASPGNPPLKQNGQLPVMMSAGGLTI